MQGDTRWLLLFVVGVILLALTLRVPKLWVGVGKDLAVVGK